MVLTKEEKKAKKEAKKLEQKIAQTEARKKAKQDELMREIAAHECGRYKLDKYWLELMTKIKEPEFRQDIEVLRSSFDRANDKKDFLIKHIMQLRRVADEQYQRTIGNYCSTADKIINTFLHDIESMKKNNEKSTQSLLEESQSKLNNILNVDSNAERHLHLLLYQSFEVADNLAWTTRGENLVKKDEETNTFCEIRDELSSYLENIYGDIWNNYRTTIRNYIANTAENQRNARMIRRKLNAIQDIIATQTKSLASSESVMRRLRAELAAYETGTKHVIFRERRTRHRNACIQLKKHLTDDKALDEKKLQLLVKVSDDSIKQLENAHKKEEKILRLAAICRKYETQREKVLPYGTKYLPERALSICGGDSQNGINQKSSQDCLTYNEASTQIGLGKLWQKMAVVELSRKALLREKMQLEHNNAVLEKILQDQEEEKVIVVVPDASKCHCVSNSSIRRPQDKPSAVDGWAELKKYANLPN